MNAQAARLRDRLAAEHARRMAAAQAAQSTRPTLAGLIAQAAALTGLLALIVAATPALVVILALHVPGGAMH